MKSLEAQLVRAMLGRSKPSVLMTDGYKFSMAQAGFPLRQETFYLSFRRPGWYYIPFDLKEVVARLCPEGATTAERAFLDASGFALTSAMEAALAWGPTVWAAPKGSWVREQEPIVSVTAPSFLASWLEPLLVWLHAAIQIATAVLKDGQSEFLCASESERTIIQLVLKAVGRGSGTSVMVNEALFLERVKKNAEDLVSATRGDGERLFEVGMRSAHSMEMHRAALVQVAKAGITKTSNAFLAHELGLTLVGTTGHEHQQRWGRDLEGFRAIRDMRSATPSYLFDTYNAMELGIPDAVQVLKESPERPATVRFDSGDHEVQLEAFAKSGVTPTYVFMDSMRPKRIADLEQAAKRLTIPPAKCLYGVGGFLVGGASPGKLTRDRVAAVYKLSNTGGRPVMKFSVPGKTSIPGQPVIFRRSLGNGPVGLIGQVGESPPTGYQILSASQRPEVSGSQVGLSPQTEQYVQELRQFHFGDAKAFPAVG